MRWLRFPRVLGLVVCAYLLAMTGLFGHVAADNGRFVRNAARTEGVVIAVDQRAPGESNRPPQLRTTALKVSYQVGTVTYSYVAAQGSYRQRLRIGERVTVLYDPNDPTQARLRGEAEILIPVIVLSFAGSAILVALILIRTRHAGHPARRFDGHADHDSAPDRNSVDDFATSGPRRTGGRAAAVTLPDRPPIR